MGTVANEAMRTYGITNGKDLVEMYPIGSIYISVDSTSPASLFGGTWEQLEGRTLIGAGTVTDENNLSQTFTLGADGGELKHTLTLDEMPSHNHGEKELKGSWRQVGENYSTGWYYSTGIVSYTTKGTNNAIKSSSNYSNQGDIFSIDASHSHDSNGGDVAHNNLPPYIVANIWKRIS